MKDFFQKKLGKATGDENKLACALARRFKLNISFPAENPEDCDYLLFDFKKGRAWAIEQKNSTQSGLSIELEVHQNAGPVKGWLHTSKADRLAWVNESTEQVYIINFQVLKDYVVTLHDEGKLKVYDFSSGECNGKKWAWESSPTTFAVIDFPQLEEDLGKDICVFTFEELNLNYDN